MAALRTSVASAVDVEVGAPTTTRSWRNVIADLSTLSVENGTRILQKSQFECGVKNSLVPVKKFLNPFGASLV